MPINVPNQITLLRLVLAIVFFAVMGQYSQRQPRSWLLDIGLVTFVIAAATDYLDGYYARKHNQVTSLGRILDPFVDKVLVCGAFIFLAGPGFCGDDGENATGLRPWMVVVVLGRELLVTGLRGFSESRGVAYGAEFIGKAKMWVQSITVGALLLIVARYGSNGPQAAVIIKTLFVWLTVVVTSASLVTYLMKSRGLLLEAHQA
ncbi:MAG: CDP-diacylglycerol--glycerol-3-phosphate 3-phosphatidyltransferase [Phycisphaerales bacterium]|nr:CDP-diacylglycerol--glycerol-3-phosphate 3-phosphatidyltransferase [Phycisphaerales bacterium]